MFLQKTCCRYLSQLIGSSLEFLWPSRTKTWLLMALSPEVGLTLSSQQTTVITIERTVANRATSSVVNALAVMGSFSFPIRGIAVGWAAKQWQPRQVRLPLSRVADWIDAHTFLAKHCDHAASTAVPKNKSLIITISYIGIHPLLTAQLYITVVRQTMTNTKPRDGDATLGNPPRK